MTRVLQPTVAEASRTFGAGEPVKVTTGKLQRSKALNIMLYIAVKAKTIRMC